MIEVKLGDCRKVLSTQAPGSFDAVVTDPPYGLKFMGRDWDHGVPGIPYWSRIIRVLKPGGYLLAFGGTRTYHRLTCAIEDAGFEIRDCLMWIYGTGFPKGKGCLKPAWEPILLARKPGPKVLPLGIDDCRVPVSAEDLEAMTGRSGKPTENNVYSPGIGANHEGIWTPNQTGRYPANVVHDGSDEVMEAFAAFGEKKAGVAVGRNASAGTIYGNGKGLVSQAKGDDCLGYGDTGTAARFFYCAKASKAERGEGNTHPTVKPLALMKWLVTLVSREGEKILDPFMGSGTTGKACKRLGRDFLGIDNDKESYLTSKKRLNLDLGSD